MQGLSIVLLCNGSTADSGSVSWGSNPYRTTKLKNTTCKPLKIGGSFKTSYVNYCLFLIVIVQFSIFEQY